MSNFIDRFEAQLVATAPRPLRAHERLRRWIAGHAVASIAIAVTATAATAGAAVTTLTGTPSAPLVQKVDVRTAKGTEPGLYRIVMTPAFAVGEPAWCNYFALSDTPQAHYSVGCLQAPRSSEHIAQGGIDQSLKPSLAEFVVDDQVAGIRQEDGRVVLSRADPALPNGWRAIVFQSDAPGAGRFAHHHLRDWKLLDAEGRVIGDADYRRTMAFDAGKPAVTVDGELPPSAPCRITRTDSRPWPHPVQSIGMRSAPRPMTGLNGHPFLACAAVESGNQDGYVTGPQATLLLDATAPNTRRPDPLPGMSGPDDGSVVQVPVSRPPMDPSLKSPTGMAQRRGNAWLVVSGSTPAQQRLLISRLTTRVNLG